MSNDAKNFAFARTFAKILVGLLLCANVSLAAKIRTNESADRYTCITKNDGQLIKCVDRNSGNGRIYDKQKKILVSYVNVMFRDEVIHARVTGLFQCPDGILPDDEYKYSCPNSIKQKIIHCESANDVRIENFDELGISKSIQKLNPKDENFCMDRFHEHWDME